MVFEIYFYEDSGMSSTFQLVFVCTQLLNTLCMPVIIWYSLKKMKQILDPLINKSYSMISIQILKVIILQSSFVMISRGMLTVQFVYDEGTYASYAEYKKHRYLYSKILNSIVIIFDYLVIFLSFVLSTYQAYEWAIMIHMIVYQQGKEMKEIMF